MTELWKKILRGILRLRAHNIGKRLAGYGCAAALLAICLWAQPQEQAPGPVVPPQSTGSTAATSPSKPAAGKLRLFTCDAQLYDSFTQLAAQYSQLTGTEVLVSTTEPEESCQEALQRLAGAGQMPTVFCMHSQADLAHWESRLFDLTGEAILEQLYSPEFAVTLAGKTVALTADVAGYGLMYNAALLAKAGFTRTDINNFSDLETACQFITNKSLGFSAFSAPTFGDGSATGFTSLLLDSASGSDSLQGLWNLLSQNYGTGTGSLGLRQFLGGFCVFHVTGSWDYNRVELLGTQNLDILPLYSPDGGSMAYSIQLCWGLDRLAESQALQVALDFLQWLVTAPEEGSAPVDQLGLLAPFQDCTSYRNPLEKKLRSYMASEPARVRWLEGEIMTQEQLTDFATALSRYSRDPSEETWRQVLNTLSID